MQEQECEQEQAFELEPFPTNAASPPSGLAGPSAIDPAEEKQEPWNDECEILKYRKEYVMLLYPVWFMLTPTLKLTRTRTLIFSYN